MGKIVEELIKGRDLTKELQILIRKPFRKDLAVSQQKELLEKIFRSLSEALSMMKNSYSEYSGQSFQIPGSSDDRKSVNSGQSCKRPVVKDTRGDRKRRKSSDSWIKVSSSVVDEYAWRKYGQKETAKATFPRCYFRCTHKLDQGCKATRQVQRIQEEPAKYQITYFGQHTCRKILQPNLENIILDSYSKEANIINFQSYTPSGVYLFKSCLNSIQEENKKVQSDLTSEEVSPSLSDSITWPDLAPLMSSSINKDILLDVDSYTSSIDYHGIDMDFFSMSDDFSNCFESNF